MNAPKQHLKYLDSARGLAALSVVIYHFIGWKWSDKLSIKTASILFNGSDAVSFFFVLSGFVLSFNYFQSQKEPDFKNYFLKRIFRLYPAYVFTVILNYLYWHRYELNFDLVLNILYYNNDLLWEELLMVGNNHKFFIPGWTLGVEMAVSLLLPIFIIASLRNSNTPYYFIIISLFLASHISQFVFHFVLGMLVAYKYDTIANFKFRESKWFSYRFVLIPGVILLYSIRHITRIYPSPDFIVKIQNFLHIDLFHLTGIASFFIIIAIINNKKIQSLLEIKALTFIGKISYSIYLMHWLVVVYIMEHWEELTNFFPGTFYFDFIGLLAITLFITITLSTLVYYLIELPFINLVNRFISIPAKSSDLKTSKVF